MNYYSQIPIVLNVSSNHMFASVGGEYDDQRCLRPHMEVLMLLIGCMREDWLDVLIISKISAKTIRRHIDHEHENPTVCH
jgi:hypothetical protein